MKTDTKTHPYSITLSDGFTVYMPHLVLDEDAMTIVAMQTIGPEQAVNANWAAIVNGGATVSIFYTTIKLSGMKQHSRMKGTLPCGWTENWLLHDQVSITHMDVGHEFFYVLDADEDEETLLSRFFVMLDKALPIPMLPDWKRYLWDEGSDDDLITGLAPGDCINLYAWKVENNIERWERIVEVGLRNRSITF